jgi:hypothetical protein
MTSTHEPVPELSTAVPPVCPLPNLGDILLPRSRAKAYQSFRAFPFLAPGGIFLRRLVDEKVRLGTTDAQNCHRNNVVRAAIAPASHDSSAL